MIAAGSVAYISLFTICGIIAFFSRKTGATMGICFVGILIGGKLDICQTIGISLIWIILFWTVGYLKFQKTELK